MNFIKVFGDYTRNSSVSIRNHPLHNPNPDYLRALVEKIGKSQRQIAIDLDISESIFRSYLIYQHKSSYRECPYVVQFALEQMAEHDQIKQPDEVDLLLMRVLTVYEKHGISITQIPKFTPLQFGITLSVLSNKEQTLSKFSPEYLEWLSQSFGVRLKWIEVGGNERIYDYNNYYKSEHTLLKWLFDRDKYSDPKVEAWAFKDTDGNPDKSIEHGADGETHVGLVFAEEIEITKGNFIKRYRVSQPWDWNYWRSRYQLKSIVRICELNKLYFKGYTIAKKSLYDVAGGRVFPQDILKDLCTYDWYIDDYVDKPFVSENNTNSGSCCAKDIDETDKIYQYMKDHYYEKFIKKEF